MNDFDMVLGMFRLYPQNEQKCKKPGFRHITNIDISRPLLERTLGWGRGAFLGIKSYVSHSFFVTLPTSPMSWYGMYSYLLTSNHLNPTFRRSVQVLKRSSEQKCRGCLGNGWTVHLCHWRMAVWMWWSRRAPWTPCRTADHSKPWYQYGRKYITHKIHKTWCDIMWLKAGNYDI